MYVFAIAAGMMVVILLAAASQRPRPAVIVAAILWLLYAVYEYFVANGVLCDADCNIRVDLVLFFPVLAIATFFAWRSYMGLAGQPVSIGMTGLIVLALLAVLTLGPLGLAVVGAVAIGIYVARARSKSGPSANP